jgi:AhpD family alkylhydroperoxidase
MKNPALVVPEALSALLALGKATESTGVPYVTFKLVQLRASQINGCSVCVEMHALELKKAGTSDERIFAVAAWRDTNYFTPAERAALGLAEAVTRVADRGDPVSDELWAEVTKHYDEKAIAGLLLSIGLINTWNRLNASVRGVAGQSWS